MIFSEGGEVVFWSPLLNFFPFSIFLSIFSFHVLFLAIFRKGGEVLLFSQFLSYLSFSIFFSFHFFLSFHFFPFLRSTGREVKCCCSLNFYHFFHFPSFSYHFFHSWSSAREAAKGHSPLRFFLYLLVLSFIFALYLVMFGLLIHHFLVLLFLLPFSVLPRWSGDQLCAVISYADIFILPPSLATQWHSSQWAAFFH